jgi:hypothetical protein
LNAVATTGTKGREALQESLAGYLQGEQVAQIRQQYHSFNSLKQSEKIKAVKDTNLNPLLFDDPYDGLVNSLSRWSQQAPAFTGKDDATKTAVASDYYDKWLLPLYQKIGAAPLSKDVWLRNAWSEGLKYDPSQAYRNPILKGFLKGLDTATAEGANAIRTLTNVAGIPVVGFMDSIKSGDYTGLTGFYNLAMNMHNRVKQDGLVTGVAKTIETAGERNPLGGSKFMHDVASSEEFWSDVTPAREFSEKATSFVVENGMLLPLFGAIGKASELGVGLVGKAAEGVPYIENLTKTLNATKQGQVVAKMLTYGTEGLAFGSLTTDASDKKDAWKMALQFAAAGTLFSFAGKGAAKLVEHLPEGEEKAAMAAAEEEAELGAQGKEPATKEEVLDQYRTHMASVMAAGGQATAHSIVEEALAHVAMEEKAPLEDMDRLKWHQDLSDADHVRWMTVLTNMNMIKHWLDFRDLKLTELEPDQLNELVSHIHNQLDRAAAEIDMRVPQVKEMKGQKLTGDQTGAMAVQKAAEAKNVEGPSNVARNQPSIDHRLPLWLSIAKPKYSYGVGNSFDLKFEDPRDMVAYIIGNKGKSSSHAQYLDWYKKEFPNASYTDIQEHAQKVRDSIKQQAKNWRDEENRTITVKPTVARQIGTPPAQRTESRYEYSKGGKITGYQMGISFNWNVAKDNLAKAKEGKNTDKFWRDYVETLTGKTDDPDSAAQAFAEDLRDYFNPTKDYGLQFEGGRAGQGTKDYTNFLAYMYGFRSKLPKPVAAKLEDVLMNSPKMSALLGSRPTVEKLEEFSQAIHNHIDYFTRSKWYQDYGQRNVFRSSQPGIKGEDSLSKWQRDKKLVESAHKKDLMRGKEFYPGKSKAAIEARARYEGSLKILQGQELAAYLEGNPSKVAKIVAKARKIVAAAGGQ